MSLCPKITAIGVVFSLKCLQIVGDLEGCLGLALDFIHGDAFGDFDEGEAGGEIDVEDGLREIMWLVTVSISKKGSGLAAEKNLPIR